MIERKQDTIYKIDDHKAFNFSSGELMADGEGLVPLSRLQGILFQAFVTHPDIVLGRGELTGELYPDEPPRDEFEFHYDKRVDTMVSRVRGKLRRLQLDEQLETINGRGYRWSTDPNVMRIKVKSAQRQF